MLCSTMKIAITFRITDVPVIHTPLLFRLKVPTLQCTNPSFLLIGSTPPHLCAYPKPGLEFDIVTFEYINIKINLHSVGVVIGGVVVSTAKNKNQMIHLLISKLHMVFYCLKHNCKSLEYQVVFNEYMNKISQIYLKLDVYVIFFLSHFFMFFVDTQTSNNIQFGINELSFIFVHPITCQTNKHIEQQYNMCVLGYNIEKYRMRISDWSVENMNPEVTSNGLLVDVSVSPKIK